MTEPSDMDIDTDEFDTVRPLVFDDGLDDDDPPGEDEPDSGGVAGVERDVDPDNVAEDELDDDPEA